MAAGKGVTIARTIQEAKDAIVKSLESEIFGEAGKKIVIEEFLEGEEASFIVITDGKTAIPFASSQDHKARDVVIKDLIPEVWGLTLLPQSSMRLFIRKSWMMSSIQQ